MVLGELRHAASPLTRIFLKPSSRSGENNRRFRAILCHGANPKEVVIDDEVLKLPFIDLADEP